MALEQILVMSHLNDPNVDTSTKLCFILVLVFCGSILYGVFQTIYNLYFHPLSKYPGPRLAAISRLWMNYEALQGRLSYTITELHKHYGDVVRTAPDELSFISADAWNGIYGHRTGGKAEVMKDPWFYNRTSVGPGSLFSASRERHGYMRKQFSHGFSERALKEQESIIRDYADLCIQRLQEVGKNGAISLDATKWYNLFTFDVMGELTFGESFDCLQSSEYHIWVSSIFDSIKFSFYKRTAEQYRAISSLISLFLVPSGMKERQMRLKSQASAKYAHRKAIADDKKQSDRPVDFFTKAMKPEVGLTEQELFATSKLLILAGSETTATLLSGCTYLLLRNPEVMQKAVTEVRSAFSTPEDINFISVNGLPYVMACLNEALRYYPPVPEGFPRNTMNNQESIHGQDVPPHTKVRVSQYAAYHSPSNFTDPDSFVPERWLSDDECPIKYRNDNRAAVQPFSVGPRNCLGRNLAIFEMRLMLTLALWHFDLELCPESRSWINHKTYVLWEKPQMMVRFKDRADAIF